MNAVVTYIDARASNGSRMISIVVSGSLRKRRSGKAMAKALRKLAVIRIINNNISFHRFFLVSCQLVASGVVFLSRIIRNM